MQNVLHLDRQSSKTDTLKTAANIAVKGGLTKSRLSRHHFHRIHSMCGYNVGKYEKKLNLDPFARHCGQ